MGLLELSQECLDAAEGKMPERPIGPDGKKAKPANRMRVFKSDFIETYLAQAHPITPGIWFGGFVIYGLYAGIRDFALVGIPLFLLGVLITTLIEYFLHRVVFHFNAKNEKERLQLFLMHGYHHDFPNDPMRLVLPPIVIWPFAAIVAGLWYLAFGAYFWPVYGGTCAGYIAYDWMHYYTHYFNPKKGTIGYWIKRYHMLHHHDSPNHRYGITSPLWDLAFGTYLPNNKLIRQAGRHTPPASEQASEQP